MNEIAAQFYREPFGLDQLDTTQRQILNILKLNEEVLGTSERELLKQLEKRLPQVYDNNQGSGIQTPQQENIDSRATADKPTQKRAHPGEHEEQQRPVKAEPHQAGMPFLSQDDVEDVLGDLGNGATGRPAQQPTAQTSQQPQPTEEDPESMTTTQETVLLPPSFSLLSALKVPITVTAAEVLTIVNDVGNRNWPN